MTCIGFELFASQGLSILPGYEFSMSIVDSHKKLVSSIGKDVYHKSGFILPDKRIAATGRFHHLSETTINPYEPLQTLPCIPSPYKNESPSNLRVKLSIPHDGLTEKIIQTTYFILVKKEKKREKRVPLFLDRKSFQSISNSQLLIDITMIIGKHL